MEKKIGRVANFADCCAQLSKEVNSLSLDCSQKPDGFLKWVTNVEKNHNSNEQHKDAMNFWLNCFLDGSDKTFIQGTKYFFGINPNYKGLFETLNYTAMYTKFRLL